MPQHLRALADLAALNLPLTRLQRALAEETIGPHSSASSIRRFGQSLGLVNPRPRIPSAEKAVDAAPASLPTLAWSWVAESIERRREHFRSIGFTATVEALPPEYLAKLRDRFERQRPRALKRAAERLETQALDQALSERAGCTRH
jgi:hypothetical protein